MNNKTKLVALVVVIVLITGIAFTTYDFTQDTTTSLILNNDFVLSETTYTNISIEFTDGDPYNGHSVWTYTVGAPTHGLDPSGWYSLDCDSGEYVFFGIDEFVNNSIPMAEIEVRTVEFSGGTYHYQFGYFYQKTNLESNTRWALILYWSASGLRLYYNTGNGNTPNYVTLNTSTPQEGNDYTYFLYNFGDSTYVQVIDISPLGDGVIYDGYVSTPAYDATSLYVGFGEYCTSGINTWSRWDNFKVYDVHFDIPADGYGFSTIEAYIDEAYAHTFYDVVSGYNSSLEIGLTVTNITLVIQCWVNGTLFDIATVEEGINRIRHNVTVTSSNNTIVFSQSNFMYSWGIEYSDDLFLYEYWVELDFVLVSAEIYTVIITYEVFY